MVPSESSPFFFQTPFALHSNLTGIKQGNNTDLTRIEPLLNPCHIRVISLLYSNEVRSFCLPRQAQPNHRNAAARINVGASAPRNSRQGETPFGKNGARMDCPAG